jgi:hypothetical protein
LVTPFNVVDDAAVLAGEGGKFDGDGEVGGLGVADGVADVVRERADSEGQLVGVAGISEEIDDEVSRAHVVSEVGERIVAKGVVTDVLNDATAIGVGASVFEIGKSEVGIVAEKKRDDRVSPSEVDELLVSEEGVCGDRARAGEEQQEEQGGEEAGWETGCHWIMLDAGLHAA